VAEGGWCAAASWLKLLRAKLVFVTANVTYIVTALQIFLIFIFVFVSPL